MVSNPSVNRFSSPFNLNLLSKTYLLGWIPLPSLLNSLFLTVSFGLSVRTVPIPVKIASEYALNLCTSALDSFEVIHLLPPFLSPIPPSNEQAILHVTKGRLRLILEKKPRFSSKDSFSSKPDLTLSPAFFSFSTPF